MENNKFIKDEIIKKASEYGKSIGIYINDLKGNIIEYNSNNIYASASCIKLFILLEYYRQIYEGIKRRDDILTYEKRHYTEGAGSLKLLDYGLKLKSKDLATLMIAISDNIATNILIEYLGMENIQNNIKNLGFENTKILSDFYFPKKEPVGYITAKEYGLVFEKIINNRLYNEEICKEILEILKRQYFKDILTKMMTVEYKKNTDLLQFVASKSGKRAGVEINRRKI